MANPHIGKLFSIYFLFAFSILPASRVLVISSPVSIQGEDNQEPEQSHYSTNYFNQQQILVNKLEELVRNLSDVVTKLESRLSDPPSFPSINKKQSVTVDGSKSTPSIKSEKVKDIEEGRIERRIGDGERARAISVTKYSPFWSERFQFVSAVKLDSDATCINVLPFKDYEGLSKYVAVGDERGRVYVFLRNGDVAVEYYTVSESPITTMLSYMSVYKNESFFVTGHQNGVILMHRIWEGSNVEEWNSLYMESLCKFVMTDSGEEDRLAVTILEVHHVGRMRYILSADGSGKIRVFRENGTVYGSVMPTSRPLLFLKQRLMFLTETGSGSLDLRSMRLRESECEGLNHSLARSYIFDATERSKAYGLTSAGDLIQVLLLGDIMNFKCRVRSKRKLDVEEPVVFQAIKGYLVVVSNEKVVVYNVSSQHYVRVGAPRLLFSAGLDEIRSSFLSFQNADLDSSKWVLPLVASDREKLVVLGLGGGYVGMYRSNLPVFKGEFNTILWSSPVLLFLLFLWGAWQFFAKKKEALTSWGPDVPFSSTSATTGAPLGTDMDLRVRPPRRYGSPTRYSGGTTSSFRTGGSTDHNARPAAVDTNFRAASEMKFRGSNLEPPGFPKRRESLFANNQVVDENS